MGDLADNTKFDNIVNWAVNPIQASVDSLVITFGLDDNDTFTSLYDSLSSMDYMQIMTNQANSNAFDVLSGESSATDIPQSWFGDSDVGGFMDSMLGAEGADSDTDDDDTSEFDTAIANAYAGRKGGGDSNTSLTDDDDDDDSWFSSLLG